MAIYCIGETVFDIIFKDNNVISGKVGGSSLNTAVSLARSGCVTYFISYIGNDKLGLLIRDFLNENNINQDFVFHYNGNSSIALAFMDEDSKAEYQFYKTELDAQSIQTTPEFNSKDVFIFASSLALSDVYRPCLMELLQNAKYQRSLIIYDPNIRVFDHTKVNYLIENIELADVVKASEDDITLIVAQIGHDTWQSVIKNKVLIITLGDKGAEYHYHNEIISSSSRKTNVISTIGAGDNFTAGFINYLQKNGGASKILSNDSLIFEALEMGNLYASEVCGTLDNYISEDFAKDLN